MDALNTKLEALNLQPISDEVFEENLKAFADENQKEFLYYKMYNETPMFYSKEYLEDKSLEYLLENDRENKIKFE